MYKLKKKTVILSITIYLFVNTILLDMRKKLGPRDWITWSKWHSWEMVDLVLKPGNRASETVFVCCNSTLPLYLYAKRIRAISGGV